MNRKTWIAAGIVALLFALAAGSRLLVECFDGYPPNLHAVIAVSLFGGFYFRSRATAIALPLAAMLASDLVIGGYDGRVMAVVYTGLILPVVCRGLLRERLTPGRVVGAALGSAFVFFLMSNFAVWLWIQKTHTAATLARCYVNAAPFFKYELLGDVLFTAALFSVYALVTGVQTRAARVVSA